jgi:hypothetical protein
MPDKNYLLETNMKNTLYSGKGWIEVPEAKLQAGDEITGWVVKRDLWFFALYAQVEIKIDAPLSSVNITHFVVRGTEASVKQFEKILKRAVGLHNQQRFPNMQVPKVRWEMKTTSKQQIRGRR